MQPKIIHDLQQAAGYLREGRVVAVATGTSYAFAADALQGFAVQRLRQVKGRTPEKTFTVFLEPVLVPDFFEVNPAEQRLIERLPEAHLTLLLRTKSGLAHLAQDGRVGLRFIDHPHMAALASELARPLTATSANQSGEPPCFEPQCIVQKCTNPIDPSVWIEGPVRGTQDTTYDLSLAAVLDAGKLSEGDASTIVRIEDGQAVIVRPGAVSLKEINSHLK